MNNSSIVIFIMTSRNYADSIILTNQNKDQKIKKEFNKT